MKTAKKWGQRITKMAREAKTPDAFLKGLRTLLGMAPETPPGSTFIQRSYAHNEHDEDRQALKALGIFPVAVEADCECVRVTYAVTPQLALRPQA